MTAFGSSTLPTPELFYSYDVKMHHLFVASGASEQVWIRTSPWQDIGITSSTW